MDKHYCLTSDMNHNINRLCMRCIVSGVTFYNIGIYLQTKGP